MVKLDRHEGAGCVWHDRKGTREGGAGAINAVEDARGGLARADARLDEWCKEVAPEFESETRLGCVVVGLRQAEVTVIGASGPVMEGCPARGRVRPAR